jgi:hypothetical protein
LKASAKEKENANCELLFIVTWLACHAVSTRSANLRSRGRAWRNLHRESEDERVCRIGDSDSGDWAGSGDGLHTCMWKAVETVCILVCGGQLRMYKELSRTANRGLSLHVGDLGNWLMSPCCKGPHVATSYGHDFRSAFVYTVTNFRFT